MRCSIAVIGFTASILVAGQTPLISVRQTSCVYCCQIHEESGSSTVSGGQVSFNKHFHIVSTCDRYVRS